jgi:MFS family permease
LFTQSSSNIAWIGSIQAFLLLFVGAISGPIFDRGYLRTLLAVGSFLIIFGYMMLSICKAYWEVVLAQGFCIGIGGGLLFIPAIALLPTYFRRRLGLAVGLAAAGSSMGGIIYPIVFYRLIDRIGFGWSTRVIGFITLATLLVPNLVMRQRIRPPKARALIDTTAFRDRPYLLFVFGAITGFTGLYVMLFYISFCGEVHGYTDRSLSFYVIPILNAASVFGRTVPNAISDKTGPFNLIGPGALVCSILIFCMLAVKSAAGVVVVAAFFGFFSGVFIALPPVCLAALTKDKSKIGTRLGMAFGITSCSALLGGPGSGAVLGADGTDLHWTRTWVFGGVFTIFSGCLFIILRGCITGWRLMVKV